MSISQILLNLPAISQSHLWAFNYFLINIKAAKQRLSKQTTSLNIDLSYYPSQTDNDIISLRCSARDTPQGFISLQVCHGPALIKLLHSMSGVSNRECCAPRYKHNDSVQQHKSLDITAAAQNLYAKIADNEFPYQLFE